MQAPLHVRSPDPRQYFLNHNRMPACFLGTRSVACLTHRLRACLDACARSPPQKVAHRRRCVTFHQIVAQRRQNTRGTGRRVAAATRARAHRVVMGAGHRLGDQEVQSEKISSHPLIRSLPLALFINNRTARSRLHPQRRVARSVAHLGRLLIPCFPFSSAGWVVRTSRRRGARSILAEI